MGEYSALNVPMQAGFVTFQSIPLLRDHFRVCEIIFLIAKRYHRGACDTRIAPIIFEREA